MIFSKLAPLFLAASGALAQTFSVNTPASLPQCLPAQIQITGGTAPYILAAIPGGQPSAPAIATIASNIPSSPYVWTVNLAVGLNITLRVTDATGALTYSSPLVIQAGVSNSCLNAAASTSGLATGGSVTTTVTTSGTQSGSVSASITTSRTVAPSSASSVSASASSSSVSGSGTSSRPASSAPASSSVAWAMPTAMAGMPAIAIAAVGGVAAFL